MYEKSGENMSFTNSTASKFLRYRISKKYTGSK